MVHTNRNKVIIFYDEKDTRYLDRLHVHLSYYENKDLLEVWDNTNISPGEIRREERQKALASAKVAVLLISADFLASKFVDDELPVLLDAQKADGAIILSIIIGPCAFHDTELSEFQAINNPLKQIPLISLYCFMQPLLDKIYYTNQQSLIKVSMILYSQDKLLRYEGEQEFLNGRKRRIRLRPLQVSAML
jgi:hypothetical protein